MKPQVITDRKWSTPPTLRGNRNPAHKSFVLHGQLFIWATALRVIDLWKHPADTSLDVNQSTDNSRLSPINTSCPEAPIQTLWNGFNQKNSICVLSLGETAANLQRVVQHRQDHVCSIQSNQSNQSHPCGLIQWSSRTSFVLGLFMLKLCLCSAEWSLHTRKVFSE